MLRSIPAVLSGLIAISIFTSSSGEIRQGSSPFCPWLEFGRPNFNFDDHRSVPSRVEKTITDSLASVSVISKDIDWNSYKEQLPLKLAEAEKRVKDHVAGIAAAFQSFPCNVPLWHHSSQIGFRVVSTASDKLRQAFQSLQDRVAGTTAKGRGTLDVAHSEPDYHSPIGFSEHDVIHGPVANNLDAVNRCLTERVLNVMAKTDW
jgi:hypothetical protein